jgi:hypothetical protein
MKGYLAIREGDILCVPQNNNGIVKHMALIFYFLYQAILNPILYNATCYPGIICDGTENSFFNCKYDRAQTSTKITDLFAIITRCIGKKFF